MAGQMPTPFISRMVWFEQNINSHFEDKEVLHSFFLGGGRVRQQFQGRGYTARKEFFWRLPSLFFFLQIHT